MGNWSQIIEKYVVLLHEIDKWIDFPHRQWLYVDHERMKRVLEDRIEFYLSPKLIKKIIENFKCDLMCYQII